MCWVFVLDNGDTTLVWLAEVDEQGNFIVEYLHYCYMSGQK